MTEELAYFAIREMNLGGKTNKEMTCHLAHIPLKRTQHTVDSLKSLMCAVHPPELQYKQQQNLAQT